MDATERFDAIRTALAEVVAKIEAGSHEDPELRSHRGPICEELVFPGCVPALGRAIELAGLDVPEYLRPDPERIGVEMNMPPTLPLQPIYQDPKDAPGNVRFRKNHVVRHMLDICTRARIFTLNELDDRFPQEDIDQFYSLIGYSVAGYRELAESDVISQEAAAYAEDMARGTSA